MVIVDKTGQLSIPIVYLPKEQRPYKFEHLYILEKLNDEECLIIKYSSVIETHNSSFSDESIVQMCFNNGFFSNEEIISYDLIIGAVANDDVFQSLQLYLTGLYTKEQTLAALKIKKLYDQYVFATEKALGYLKFIGWEEVQQK